MSIIESLKCSHHLGYYIEDISTFEYTWQKCQIILRAKNGWTRDIKIINGKLAHRERRYVEKVAIQLPLEYSK